MQTFKERQNATAMDTRPASQNKHLEQIQANRPDGLRRRGTNAMGSGMEKEGNNTSE
jgi:hypothetical protein